MKSLKFKGFFIGGCYLLFTAYYPLSLRHPEEDPWARREGLISALGAQPAATGKDLEHVLKQMY